MIDSDSKIQMGMAPLIMDTKWDRELRELRERRRRTWWSLGISAIFVITILSLFLS